jgi:hypothetical protein
MSSGGAVHVLRSRLASLAGGSSAIAAVVVVGHLGSLLAGSILGLLAILVVVLALVGCLAALMRERGEPGHDRE